MPRPVLTVDRLKHFLDYDPETGIFTWRHPRSTNIKPGQRAGAAREFGYRVITIEGQKHLESVLAWMWVHGEKPTRPLRFKNGDHGDSRINNLGFGEFHYVTPEGRKAYDRQHRKRSPETYKNQDLKKFFGITLAEYKAMLIAQKGVCAICGQPETKTLRGRLRALAVDHNHSTNQVRDLLCYGCNLAVGHARENPAILRAAADYLERHARPATDLMNAEYGLRVAKTEGTDCANVVPLRKESA